MFWRLYHARALIPCGVPCYCRGHRRRRTRTSPASTAIRSVSFEHTAALSAEDRQKITQFLQQEDTAWVARQR